MKKICLLLNLISFVSFAKGLDNLSAEEPSKEESATEAVTEETDGTVSVAKEEMVRSQTSLFLEDRLKLETGSYFVFGAKADGQTLATQGTASVTAKYKIPTQVGPLQNNYARFRFMPLDGVWVKEKSSYRGVFINYLFGLESIFFLNEKWNIQSAFDMGLGIAKFHSLDLGTFESSKSKPPGNVFLIAFEGGADYNYNSKFYFGPRLGLGLGGESFVHLGGAANFVF